MQLKDNGSLYLARGAKKFGWKNPKLIAENQARHQRTFKVRPCSARLAIVQSSQLFKPRRFESCSMERIFSSKNLQSRLGYNVRPGKKIIGNKQDDLIFKDNKNERPNRNIIHFWHLIQGNLSIKNQLLTLNTF